MHMALRLLLVASETPDQRDARREHAGAASNETLEVALRSLRSDLEIAHRSCVDGERETSDLSAFDGVLFAGSPIQMHAETRETRAAASFMTQVYASGTPAFGSCAGLQIAAVAAGGTCKPRDGRMEAAFARGITATAAGRKHPLLDGRPMAWDAPAMHSSIVDTLPPSATLLAGTKRTPVEAVEIRHGSGVFWGVQYHPELALWEIAAALRRQAPDLIEQGLAADEQAVTAYAAQIQALDEDPGRLDLAWQLGLDDEVTDNDRRRLELRNFLHFVSERQ